jgi:hypothetical protein
MLSRWKTIQPLLHSSGGLHVSAYLPAVTSRDQHTAAIQSALETARKFIVPHCDAAQASQFLHPLEKLLRDDLFLSQFKQNWSLFRNSESLRMVTLSTPPERLVVVANSFHIKPLLRWMQSNPEYIVIEVTGSTVQIYNGLLRARQTNFNMVDRQDLIHVFREIRRGIGAFTFLKAPRVEQDEILRLASSVQLPVQILPESLKDRDFTDTTSLDELREYIHDCSVNQLETLLTEYWTELEHRNAKNNLFEIAKAAVSGRVKKLVVAEDMHIFGKIDPQTGGLQLNPMDTDHEDDDLLDDIAQAVILHQGEVIVTSRSNIPKLRPMLAILRRPEEYLRYKLANTHRVA